ncbi:MAG: histidine phosphatase family protein, partial [Caldilineaceae bacterium]|nr:histidine phosphatase family protein [Caldilineaceae bacterium]
EAMGYGGDVRWHDEIYLTDAGELLTLLKKVPDGAEHVLLVGHNPGIEGLASGLCGGQPEEVFVRMPTGTLAFVELDISQWSALRWGGGQLKLLISPKSLK